jgi:hypothetical protein
MRRLGVLLALCVLLLLLGVTPMTAVAQGNQSTVVHDLRVLQDGERVNEDLVILGGTLRADAGSQVLGNIVVMGGEADIGGLVQGDIVGFGGTVQLGPTAEVAGDVVVLGTLRRHPDAKIHGSVIEGLAATARLEGLPNRWLSRSRTLPPHVTALPEMPRQASSGLLRTLRALGMMLGSVLVAALVASVLPRNLVNTTKGMLRAAPLSLGLGLLTLFLAAFLVPLLVIICIGIPVALVLVVGLVAALLLGWVAAGRIVGQALLRLLRMERDMLLPETVVGTLFITLLAQLPCIGFLLVVAVGSWGLGAVMLTRAGATADTFWRPFGPSPAQPQMPPSPPQPPEKKSDGPRDTKRLYPQ